jgi:hypothetical protein
MGSSSTPPPWRRQPIKPNRNRRRGTIPSRDKAAGVLVEDLPLGRALRGRFLLGRCGALRLHLAAIEPHDADFAAAGRR